MTNPVDPRDSLIPNLDLVFEQPTAALLFVALLMLLFAVGLLEYQHRKDRR